MAAKVLVVLYTQNIKALTHMKSVYGIPPKEKEKKKVQQTLKCGTKGVMIRKELLIVSCQLSFSCRKVKKSLM